MLRSGQLGILRQIVFAYPFKNDYVYIIKSQFDKIFKENGFNSTAFLSWAKVRDEILTADGRMTITKRILGNPTRTVAVKRKIGILTDGEA